MSQSGDRNTQLVLGKLPERPTRKHYVLRVTLRPASLNLASSSTVGQVVEYETQKI